MNNFDQNQNQFNLKMFYNLLRNYNSFKNKYNYFLLLLKNQIF